MEMTRLLMKAEQENIKVEYLNLPLNESLSFPEDDGDIVLMDCSLISSRVSETVHLAHELGHCMTGSFYNIYATLDIRQKHENRADKWAIEQLVPEDKLDEAVAMGYTEIWELAEHFDVTEDFMRKAVCWHVYGNLNVNLHF